MQAREVLHAAPCRVLLPAGCGKTQIIVRVAEEAVSQGARLLVLTHTNAGVDAIRRRLTRLGVGRKDVSVRTIAGWARALASAYPRSSGYAEQDGSSIDFEAVYSGALAALRNPHVSSMLNDSYNYLAVDEYQDCTTAQHTLIRALEQIIGPLLVFGDPLQAIYGFDDAELIEWDRDLADLKVAPTRVRPWRWHSANVDLGRYLLEVREHLAVGNPIDLDGSPLRWVKDTPEARIKTMLSMVRATGSVVILDKFDRQCGAIARRLRGLFSVMEDLDARHARDAARRIDGGDGALAAAALLELAKASFVNLPAPVTAKLPKLKAGGPMPAFKPDGSSGAVLQALADVASETTPARTAALMDAISTFPTVTLFRREAWSDLRRAVAAWEEGAETLMSAVQLGQDRKRAAGRGLPARSVTRPVLVKGQEFDHAIVIAKDGIDRRDLYVAMTRASTSLTLISPSRTLEVT